MLREFQAEIARLKAQLAERQQQRATGTSGPGSQGGSPEKAAPVGPISSGVGSGGSGAGSAAVDARAASIRQAMRAELERQLRQAATLDALTKARAAIEQRAR